MPGPTQVQSPPNDQLPHGSVPIHGHHAQDHDHHHDSGSVPANAHHLHKEALRMALGSILNPKRPYTPSSRSSSGTASPAYPYSFPHTSTPGTPSIPPPPHNTPSHGRPSDAHFGPFLHHPHLYPPLQNVHSHSHVPSPLSLLETGAIQDKGDSRGSSPDSQANSPTPSSPLSKPASRCPSPQVGPATLPDPASLPSSPPGPVLAPSPLPGSAVASKMPSGETIVSSDKCKVTFIQTLQSKSAWDALIHGSFS